MSNDNDNPATNDDNPDIRTLREQADAGRRAAARAADLERQLMLRDAGLTADVLDTKLGKALLATSEATTVEQWKADAIEFGLLKPEPTNPPEKHPDADQQQFRTGLGSGSGGAVVDQGPHPTDAALAAFHQDLGRGRNREAAATDAMAKILSAAVSGDTRVLWDEGAHLAAATTDAVVTSAPQTRIQEDIPKIEWGPTFDAMRAQRAVNAPKASGRR